MKGLTILVWVACASLNAAYALDIVENVLINFGEEKGFDATTGWNSQEGAKKSEGGIFKTEWLATEDMIDAVSLKTSDIEVRFYESEGLSLGSNLPVPDTSSIINPTPEMNQMWKSMHASELTSDITNSYWGAGSALSLLGKFGDISVRNLEANRTYVMSGLFTVGSVANLLGTQRPITLSYDNNAIIEGATFLTTQTGSVEFVDLALGNFNIAGLLGGDSFIMTWIFETSDAVENLDLVFNTGAIGVGTYASVSALAITEYGQMDNAMMVNWFENNAAMLPEPTSGALSVVSLCWLCLRRRRR